MNFTALSKTNIYLIPGQGSDARIFQDIRFDSAYCVKHIEYSLPNKNSTLQEFAKELSAQIDTSLPYILIGVSLGGMLAIEMSTFLNPVKTIIISSAKSRLELPLQYRFQRIIPLYAVVPPKLIKEGAKFLQPIFEPDRKNNKAVFTAMLQDKDPLFLKRTVKMIINWDRKIPPNDLVHIHGTKDHTLPIRNIKSTHSVEKGSHMMTLTRAPEISEIIEKILTVQ